MIKKVVFLFVVLVLYTFGVSFFTQEKAHAFTNEEDLDFEPLFGGGYLEPIDDGGGSQYPDDPSYISTSDYYNEGETFIQEYGVAGEWSYFFNG